MGERYVVGVDLGTLSARAVVSDVADGAVVGAGVGAYRHGVVDRELPGTGGPLPPDWALQVPSDYLEALGLAVRGALDSSGVDPRSVVGLATDFTACTLLPVLGDGTPLCELPGFEHRPHAYVKLWKHHAAQPQADRLNEVARDRGEVWLDRYGGRLSSEWVLPKALEIFEEDREVYERAAYLVEAADWIVWRLCGQLVRNVCTLGFKAVFQDGALPSTEYLSAVAPGFGRCAEDKLRGPVGRLGDAAGRLTPEAAALTGLPVGIVVAVGNVDAHVTAPAAGAVLPGRMVAIMGTSTCHVMSSAELLGVPGMCGVVEGGIVPGLWGYEAGQSGVGDIFGWFVDQAVPAAVAEYARRSGCSVHEHLSTLAAGQPVGGHGLVALDWHSGNRSVLVDHGLSGLLLGLTLQTRPEDVYRALIEATAFGTRMIVETFTSAGLDVSEYVAAGGLTANDLVMQVTADVLRRPVHLLATEHGPALGSAMHAAVAAGVYPDIVAAAERMATVRRDVWLPDPVRAASYDRLYAEYRLLHDHFGRGGNDVMHRLRALRNEVSV